MTAADGAKTHRRGSPVLHEHLNIDKVAAAQRFPFTQIGEMQLPGIYPNVLSGDREDAGVNLVSGEAASVRRSPRCR